MTKSQLNEGGVLMKNEQEQILPQPPVPLAKHCEALREVESWVKEAISAAGLGWQSVGLQVGYRTRITPEFFHNMAWGYPAPPLDDGGESDFLEEQKWEEYLQEVYPNESEAVARFFKGLEEYLRDHPIRGILVPDKGVEPESIYGVRVAGILESSSQTAYVYVCDGPCGQRVYTRYTRHSGGRVTVHGCPGMPC
jgi:hypothetical protein